MKKVFESYRKRKQFKELKIIIKGISQNKYDSILLEKSYQVLSQYSQNQKRLKGLVKIHQFKQNRILIERAFQALVCDRTRRTISKIGYHHVLRQIRFKLLRNSFYKLDHYTRLTKSLRHRSKILIAKQNDKIVKDHLYQMLIKYNKIKLNKQIGEEIVANRYARLEKHGFLKWLHRYRYLTQVSEEQLQMKQEQMRNDLFCLWRFKVEMVSSFRLNHANFLIDKRQRNTREVFQEWSRYAKQRAQLRKMDQVCSFIFLRK